MDGCEGGNGGDGGGCSDNVGMTVVLGTYTEKTLKRQARSINCEKALDTKLLPDYTER